MKNFLMSIVAVVLCSSFASAHGDHKEMALADAITAAKSHVADQIKGKKLVDTWKDAQVSPEETKSKSVEGKTRWFVVLTNPAEKDLSKAKFEVVMTPAGKIVSQQLMKLETTK